MKRLKQAEPITLKEVEKIAREDANVSDSKVDEFLTSKIDSLFSFASHRYPRAIPSSLFRGTLYRYQEESLGWMLNRELYQEHTLPSPTLENISNTWKMQGDVMVLGDVVVENLHSQQIPKLIPVRASTRGGILADEMGLGKTVQMLSLIATHRSRNPNHHGTLIVVPVSLLQQWYMEAKKMISNVHVYILHGKNKELEYLNQYDIVLTTYKTLMLRMKNKRFASFYWWRVILDEAHEIRNATTQTAMACFEVEAQNRWALTGTPVQNKWRDLYSLFHFLRVRPYGEFEGWLKLIEFPLDQGDDEHLKEVAEITLRNLISRLVMRRTKTQRLDVYEKPVLEKGSMIETEDDKRNPRIFRVKELGFKEITAGPVKPEADETKDSEYYVYYNDAEVSNVLVHIPPKTFDYEYFEIPDPTAYYSVNLPRSSYVLLLRLRQLSIDPLIPDADPRLQKMKRENAAMEEDAEEPPEKQSRLDFFCKNLKIISPKFVYIATQLNQLAQAQPDVKSIVFSYFTSVLDLLEVVLEQYGWINAALNRKQCKSIMPTPQGALQTPLKYVRIDGTVSTEDRARFVNLFESDRDPSIKLIIMSLKTGGVGLNLSRASKVYFMEPYFNPGAMNQAIDRVHRIGQVREVNVEVLISRGSVEEKMIDLLDLKAKIASSSLSSFVKPGKEILSQLLE